MAKSRRKWVWAGIGTLLVAGFLIVVGGGDSGVPVRGAKVEKGLMEEWVEVRAKTALPHIYHITMPMQGRVLPIPVKVGDQVKAGDVLAQLDDAEWQDATTEAASMVFAMKNWVDAAAAQVKASRIYEEYSEWEYQTDEKLQGRSVSEKQSRQSKRDYLDSKVKVEESQALYHMSQALQAITDLLPSYVARNLERTTVESPVSGTILKRYVYNERVMTPGELLLDVGNMAELEVSADVLTEDAVKISQEDEVVLFGESLGSYQLAGKVRLVEPQAFSKISSLGVEEQRVSVKITFNEQGYRKLKESGLHLGLDYGVRAKIITQKKPEAAMIPRTAIFRGIKGGWQVYKVVKGKTKLVDVGVGMLNDVEAEVISGLQLGEVVVLAPESSLTDDMNVQVEIKDR